MIRIGSLFTGIAGLDRGVEQALAQLGQASRVEWQAEKDPYARAVLAKHYPTVRRYEDVRDVDAHAPTVDLICGGFPCQDLSLAGKREGITGARSGLWSEFERCIRVLRPGLVFVENVPELAAYLGHVLGPLAELGFDAEWGLLSAAAVGAPHRRERLFILAHARSYRFANPQQQVAGVGDSPAGAVLLADPNCDGELQPQGREQGQRGRPRDGGEALADPMQSRRPRTSDGAHERGPGPSVGGWWSAEPDVGRVVDGVSPRLDARRRRARLRCLGNGVVAEQAAAAFVTLAQRAKLVSDVLVERANAVHHA